MYRKNTSGNVTFTNNAINDQITFKACVVTDTVSYVCYILLQYDCIVKKLGLYHISRLNIIWLCIATATNINNSEDAY